jgi:hypothetical protein
MVSRLARTTGLTKSEIIRKAIGAYVSRPSRPGGRTMPYEMLGHLLGCARGGPPDLSERTGEKFRRLLLERKRR